jgi:hypothetical protein
MSKKINEMNSASGGAVSGFGGNAFGRARTTKKIKERTVPNAFTPSHKAVYPGEKSGNPERPLKRPKHKKRPEPYKTAAETALREAIRNIIFLNKIKFYEEQTKVALEENKLRYIIRNLLNEVESQKFDTTGQNKADDALKRLKVTFDEYTDLSSSKEEREGFKKAYISGLMAVFDSEDKSTQLFSQTPSTGTTPATNLPPAKRDDLEEQGEAPEAQPSTQPAPEDVVKQQAAAAATAAVGVQSVDAAPNEIKSAIEALNRDVPQIITLYRQLSDKPITVKGRQTTNRKDFKMFLVGDESKAGNIQITFDKQDKLSPSSDQEQAVETKPVITSAEQPAAQPAAPATPEAPVAPEAGGEGAEEEEIAAEL